MPFNADEAEEGRIPLGASAFDAPWTNPQHLALLSFTRVQRRMTQRRRALRVQRGKSQSLQSTIQDVDGPALLQRHSRTRMIKTGHSLEITMRILRLVAAGTTMLIAGGCTDGRTLEPTAPAVPIQRQAAVAAPSAAQQVAASGDYDALVKFETLRLTPRGHNCLLVVDGTLVFRGTIEGQATGTTSALVKAPCSDVATTPPGTYADVFKSELVFKGTVNGQPAQANVLYLGGVEPGGHIDGRLVFSNGVEGRLNVSATVAVGGTYSGSVVVH